MRHFTDFSRRGLLLGGLAAAAAASVPTFASAKKVLDKGVLKMWPAGIQLWTVNDQLKADVPGTLKAVKAAGFDIVETAGTAGMAPADFLKAINDAGLKCRSSHTAMGDLIDNLDQKIADAQALGSEWLVCSSPKPPMALPANEDWVKAMIESMTPDAWKFNADQLAKIAPVVAKAGLKLAYHNHPMEWKDLGNGQCGYDILMAAVPADLLRCELDLGWVFVGGRDPVEVMKKYAGRVDLLHIKDMIKDPTAPIGFRSVDLGKGLIDWKPVFKTAHHIGVKQFFYEQEAPYLEPVMQSLSVSHDYLASI